MAALISGCHFPRRLTRWARLDDILQTATAGASQTVATQSPFIPVTGSEIFSRLSADEADQLFESLYVGDKPTYKASVQITAQRRRLRATFLDKKPRPERHVWMRDVLALRANDDAATEILQNWLLGLHRPMIVDFLDVCGLQHQDAILENIPPQPDTGVLAGAVDGLLKNYPVPVPKIYLQLFQPVGGEAWPDLDQLLISDERLAPSPASV
jgi:hypothetical protein